MIKTESKMIKDCVKSEIIVSYNSGACVTAIEDKVVFVGTLVGVHEDMYLVISSMISNRFYQDKAKKKKVIKPCCCDFSVCFFGGFFVVSSCAFFALYS